jgi:LPXTG-motif cell wall-anchored protein
MDFQTAAPFLEAFFGLGAVLLAVLAVFFRRRR